VLCLRQFLQVKLPPGRLNTLEERIVAGILRGLGNDALADQLQVSRHTIEAHLTRAYQELGVRNRLELIAKTTKVA
jgi:DNA-binding CsgD family transcriptional regulator